MQYLYRPNECQMTFQEAGARQVYGMGYDGRRA